MKLSLIKHKWTRIHQVIFMLVGLIVITFFVRFAMKEVDKIRAKRDEQEKKIIEGLLSLDDIKKSFPSPDDIKNKLNDQFNSISSGVTNLGNDMGNKFEDAGNKLKDVGTEVKSKVESAGDGIKGAFTSGFNGIIKGINEKIIDPIDGDLNTAIRWWESQINEMIDVFNYIEHVIGQIESFFTNLVNLKVGMDNHIKCGAREYQDGWKNAVPIITILGRCTWEKFIDFFNGKCTKYYLVDMVFGILYGLLIELPFAIIHGLFGIDLHFITDMLHEIIIVPIDSLFYALSGYHFLSWPDTVIQKCYVCKGKLKSNSGEAIEYSKRFDWWVQTMTCGIDEMNDGLQKIIWSILPNPKWGAWSQGNTYDRDGWSGGHKDGMSILDGSVNDPDPLGPYIPMVNPDAKQSWEKSIPSIPLDPVGRKYIPNIPNI